MITNSTENSIVVRPFRTGDEEAFRRLNEEWITRFFRLEEKDRKMLGSPEAILDAGGAILMAVAGKHRVGCCALVPIGHSTLEVSKMAVTHSHQGSGIGKLILRATIEEARRLGAKRLYLETNHTLTPAIRLYESLGFKHMPLDRVTPSPYERADVYMELLL